MATPSTATSILQGITFPPGRRPPAELEAMYERALERGAPPADRPARYLGEATPVDRAPPVDIVEHMPLLRLLASECEKVIEIGTRAATGSTVALLAGQPKAFITWDLNPLAIVQQQILELLACAGRTRFEPRVGNSLEFPAEACDLLFIDSLHTAEQLAAELERHADPVAGTVRRYLVFHDTVTFGRVGEDGGPGLRQVIATFQRHHAFPLWALKYDLQNNNGLIVLERVRLGDRP